MTHAAWFRPIVGKLFRAILSEYGWVFRKSDELIRETEILENIWMSFPGFAWTSFCDFISYSQISTFMKWLFFDKCEKVKLLPHQRNIYFYRLKFPIRKFDNDLGYFRKNFEAVHQAIRGSRTSLDMVYPDLYFWWRVLSRGWLMIKKVNRIERNFCNYSWTCSVDAPQNVVILE